jgi:hypothetical protein
MGIPLTQIAFLVVSVVWMALSACGPDPGPNSTAKKVLYVTAHKDDLIFIAGKVLHDLAAGKEVHLLNIAERLPTQRPIGAEEELKQRESDPFVTIAGMDPSRLHTFPLNDPFHHAGAAVNQMAALIQKLEPDEIYLMAYCGGTADHEITHVIAVEGGNRAETRAQYFEFAVGGAQNGLFPGWTEHLSMEQLLSYNFSLIPRDGDQYREIVPVTLDDSERNTKLAIFKEWLVVPMFKGIDKIYTDQEIVTFLDHENYRMLPPYDYRHPPFQPNEKNPAGLMAYEMRYDPVSMTFADFAQFVRYVQSPIGVDLATWPFANWAPDAQPIDATSHEIELELVNRSTAPLSVDLSASAMLGGSRLDISKWVAFSSGQLTLAGGEERTATAQIGTQGLPLPGTTTIVLWFRVSWIDQPAGQQTQHIEVPFVARVTP